MSGNNPSGSKKFGRSSATGVWIDPVAVRRAVRLARFFLILFFLFCFAESSYATMKIYLKNGGSHQVHKIVFEGEKAMLYLLDGQVITLPVSQIDLPASGIGSPVGTYGQTRVTPTRKKGNIPKSLGMEETARQEELREEWEKSNRIAIAIRDIGVIRKNDRVKIVGQSSAPDPEPEPETNVVKRTYSDTYYSRYEEPETPDQAYVIIYRNPDGTFSKKLFDAATFSTYFKFPDLPKQTSSRPIVPLLPPDPDRKTKQDEPVMTIPEESQETEPRTLPPVSREVPPPDRRAIPSVSDEPSGELQPVKSRTPFYTVLLILVAAGGIGFLVWRGRNRAFLDTSKFSQYEEDLRDFEIAIWLRNGKTEEQLKEICLKKFFQDNPAALSIATKMLKGGERSWLIPYIIKQAGTGMEEADQIYGRIQEQLDRIQSLIREVSGRIGIIPQRQPAGVPADVTQKTMRAVPQTAPVITSSASVEAAPAEVPHSSSPVPPPIAEQAAPEPVPGSSTSSLVMPKMASQSPGHSAALRSESGLEDAPSYISNVLQQLGFLSDSGEDTSR